MGSSLQASETLFSFSVLFLFVSSISVGAAAVVLTIDVLSSL